MAERLNDILESFPTIALEEMDKVRLMNRVDTKYVTTLPCLMHLLEMATGEYHVQQIGDRVNMPYYTCYFDTPDCDMFAQHQRGRKTRQKIRLRVYEDSGTSFIEIKNKNNKGRTSKKRMPAFDGEGIMQYSDFIRSHSHYVPEFLLPQIRNRFRRITLVNNLMTERLTIDTDLRFSNPVTGLECSPEGIVIIELKREGDCHSPVAGMLRELRIHPGGFSKYCVGMALTNGSLKQNRLKPKLHWVRRMCKGMEYGKTGDIL